MDAEYFQNLVMGGAWLTNHAPPFISRPLRAARPTSRTSCFQRCDSSSAVVSKSRGGLARTETTYEYFAFRWARDFWRHRRPGI